MTTQHTEQSQTSRSSGTHASHPCQPGRAAKSTRYMSASDKMTRTQHVEALHLAEGASIGDAIIGRVAWARAHIPEEFLKNEPALSASCWPAYLYLSPLERTRLFTANYVQAYKYFAKQMVDHRRIPDLCLVLPVYEQNAAARISALWRARQVADELGMPYEKYLFGVIKHAIEEEGHTRLPLPNQLYDIAQIEVVHEEWTQWLAAGMLDTRGWDERLKSVNYKGDLAQAHCHDMLIAFVGQKRGLLDRVMVVEGFLPEAVARTRLGDTIVDEVLSRRSTAAPAITPSTAGPYVRPCLGLSGDQGDGACRDCPFTRQCTMVYNRASGTMTKTYSSTDPRADHVRKLARDRQRVKRAKAKIQKSVASVNVST